MSSLIQQLASQQVWEEYLAYRLQKGRLNWHEFDDLDGYVERQEYLDIAAHFAAGGRFSIPCKSVINKMGTNKKRVVYSYNDEEMQLLKVLSHLLYKYDDHFAPNCYAFRRGMHAHDAVRRVNRQVRNKRYWAYKLDIHNYFNSISVPILLRQLDKLFGEDRLLYNLFEQMLSEDRVEFEGEVVREEHGAMAGVPTASFLANVYLSEMDHHFAKQGVVYARYSDDIIIFAESLEELESHKATALKFIEEYRLEVNPTKERIYGPDEAYEFLGFKCKDHIIDLSDAGVTKMKGKISRKMRSTLRKKQRYGFSDERAMARMIAHFNRKFFDETGDFESLNWSRWYFPLINTTEGLQTIDHYLQQSIRVLVTGHHNKSNYRTTYAKLRALGYKSLVREYYRYREQREAKE